MVKGGPLCSGVQAIRQHNAAFAAYSRVMGARWCQRAYLQACLLLLLLPRVLPAAQQQQQVVRPASSGPLLPPGCHLHPAAADTYRAYRGRGAGEGCRAQQQDRSKRRGEQGRVKQGQETHRAGAVQQH